MITVHQAVYGDKGGAYALLKSSMSNTEYAKRICNVTDVLDRPSGGILTQSIFRGFAFNDSYLFIKSFPDTDPTVRRGRVLSHVLIVEQSDLPKIYNLDSVLSHFLSEINKSPELNQISLESGNSNSTQPVLSESREAVAINGLLNHSDHRNTLIWVAEDGYFPFISKVWCNLPPELRVTLKLGVGFNPPRGDSQELSILYVTEDYEAKWQAGDFCVVRKEDCGRLKSMASFLLGGHKDKSKPLNELINIFGIVPAAIEDYCYLETVVDTYKILPDITDFNRLIVFCDLISKFSQDQSVSKAEKSKLLKIIISQIESASPKQILTLQHSKWCGFANAQNLIGEQIVAWVANALDDYKNRDDFLIAIVSALDTSNKVLWWKIAFLSGLKNTLKKWQPKYAVAVWDWLSNDVNLVDLLSEYIPDSDQAEIDLVEHWPNPSNNLATHLQSFTRSRNWLTLHGMCILQLYGAEDGIKRQLEIDINSEHFDSLKKMSELTNDLEFIRIAVQIGETRIMELAATRVAEAPHLLRQIDVKNTSWRQIWLQSIKFGNDPWEGIKQPAAVIFTLFEEGLKGNAIDADLLTALSDSDHNDLSLFKQRAEVWNFLGQAEKVGFLRATALGCVKLVDCGESTIPDLENDIRNQLAEPTTTNQIICDSELSVSTKILLFEEIPLLQENTFLELLKLNIFSQAEAKRLGKLVSRNRWKKAAKLISSEVHSRSELTPALIECKPLLSFFDRLLLPISEHFSEPFSEDEWWSELTIQCCEKYPNGPTQNGIWGRVGGEDYDLLYARTGRETWTDAIKKIRNGISVSIHALLDEMLSEYPHSHELTQLRQNYRKPNAKH